MAVSQQEYAASTLAQNSTALKQNGRAKSIRSGKTLSNGCSHTPGITKICEDLKPLCPWTLSASDFPARTLAEQTHSVKGSQVKSPVYGMRVGISFAKLDPDTSSWKTHQTSFIKDLEQYSPKLPKKGMMQNGMLFHAKGSDCPKSESAYLLLPTPKKSEWIRNKFSTEALLKNIQRKKEKRSEKFRFGLDLVEYTVLHFGLKCSPSFITWIMGYPSTYIQDWWLQRGIQSVHGSLRGYSVESKKSKKKKRKGKT